MSDILARLPLSAIRVFEAAARLKSFTRAAGELGMTQAAVSWQVRALEQRLDQPLFHRLPREVTLTPAGERLSRTATEALSLLRATVADLVETEAGVLSITTVQSLGGLWLAPRLGGFQIAHPRVAVRLEATSQVIDLVGGGADVALRGGRGEWPGLEAHFLIPAIQTVLVSPGFLEQIGGLARPEDLLNAQRIGVAREWEEWFQAAGVSGASNRPAPSLVADAQTLEVASALAGQGAALGSPIFFARELAEGRLVMPFDVVARYTDGYWLAYPRERARVRKIVAFRDWVLAQVAADPLIARYAAMAPLNAPAASPLTRGDP